MSFILKRHNGVMQRRNQIPIVIKGIVLSILIIIGMFPFEGRVRAQSGPGQVAVSLKFFPVQVIAVSPTDKIADFSDVSQIDSITDAYTIKRDHLMISSSEGFQVTVESGDASLSHVSEVEAEVVLRIEKEVVAQSDTIPFFSTDSAQLIASSSRGMILKFNVTYDGSPFLSDTRSVGGNRVIENLKEFYNSNIIYTITTR